MEIQPSDTGRLLKKGISLADAMRSVRDFFMRSPHPHLGTTGIVHVSDRREWRRWGKEHCTYNYLTMPIERVKDEYNNVYYMVTLGPIEESYESRPEPKPVYLP